MTSPVSVQDALPPNDTVDDTSLASPSCPDQQSQSAQPRVVVPPELLRMIVDRVRPTVWIMYSATPGTLDPYYCPSYNSNPVTKCVGCFTGQNIDEINQLIRNFHVAKVEGYQKSLYELHHLASTRPQNWHKVVGEFEECCRTVESIQPDGTLKISYMNQYQSRRYATHETYVVQADLHVSGQPWESKDMPTAVNYRYHRFMCNGGTTCRCCSNIDTTLMRSPALIQGREGPDSSDMLAFTRAWATHLTTMQANSQMDDMTDHNSFDPRDLMGTDLSGWNH